jgi:quinol monooxygenase YgiN
MINIDMRFPTCEVTIPKSVVMWLPWKDQEIVRGSSPSPTMQETWANAPSLRISAPNVKGITFGGSKTTEQLFFEHARF